MRIPFFFLIIFTGTLARAQTITPPGAKLIAASVAMVEDRVITLRDTQIAAALQKALGKVKASEWGVELDSTSRVILDIIAAKEAGSFQIVKVSPEEIQEALKKAKDAGIMQNFTMTEGALRTLIEEKIQAEKFLLLRSEGLKTVVNDQEMREYYEKNKPRYSGMPFERHKDVIRRDLELEQRQKRFLEWFDVLKQKYKVRIYGNPDKASHERG